MEGKQMLNKVIEIFIAMMILLPVFCLLNSIRFHSKKDTVGYFVFATYMSAIYLFVGLPTLQFLRFDISITIVPFLPMIADLKNTLLNVILFVPFGFMIPVLWEKYNSMKETVTAGFCLSLMIELLQLLTYRATDINDLIANTLGTLLGYFVFRMLACYIPTVMMFAKKKNEMNVIILSVVLVMFFVQPYLANIYYQILL